MVNGIDKLKKIKEYELGVMLSATPDQQPTGKAWDILKKMPLALDNGAWSNFKKGYPVMKNMFISTLEKCYKKGLSLDFVVTPDIVFGGMKSLDYSMEWVNGELKGHPRLALVVQDGMEIKKVDHTYLENFTHLFMGGSVAWKWETALDWKMHAAKHGLKFHIGQCGQLPYLSKARDMSADSVDSSSIARNSRWDIIDEFRKGESLFNQAAKRESTD
jgi:hypothetical protein